MLKGIWSELVLIRQELQAIRSSLESSERKLSGQEEINRQLGELRMKTVRRKGFGRRASRVSQYMTRR